VTRIALVTADAALPLDPDMPPLVEALRALGTEVATPSWDDSTVDWSGFDAAVLRSTWDYVERIDEFLGWARRCSAATRLLNPVDVVAWNIDKHYLAHLHAAGVAVVPTRFVEPGAMAAAELQAFLAGGSGSVTAGAPCPFDEFVVKPSIGAGSRDAARYRRTEVGRAAAHLDRLVRAERRSAMLQPYLPSVDSLGETALVHFDGRPSHAIRKGPLLKLDEGLVAGLFAPEEITARDAGEDERAVAASACAAMPFTRPLYARVDLVRGLDGRPVVLELELTEPSVFLLHAPGSAERMARAIVERCSAPAAA
jgi:O-ureido-D-serine cyclo-ligase